MSQMHTRNKGLAEVRRKRKIFIVLMLAYPVLHLFLEWYLNFNIVNMAFRDYSLDIINGDFVGFDNFEAVFKMFDPSLEYPEYYALRNCLHLFLLVIFVNGPISLAFSYLLFLQVRGHKVLQYILYVPCITSAVVLVLAWRSVLQPNGPIEHFLTMIGQSIPYEGFLGPNTAWGSIIIFSIWTGFSTNIIYFLSCMRRVPASYIEAAKLDGAGEFRVFMSIILPLASPTICTMLSLGIAGVFSWALPSLLMIPNATHNGEYFTGTMGLTILNLTTNHSYGLAAAYGLMLTLIATPLMLSIRKLANKLESNVEY